MVDAPDRIWLSAPDDDHNAVVWFDPDEGGTAYVRADLVEAMEAARDCLGHLWAQSEAKNQRLREALAGLELACDQLAATRTREVYLAMIDSGQQAALLFLDSHRESARSALRSTREGG